MPSQGNIDGSRLIKNPDPLSRTAKTQSPSLREVCVSAQNGDGEHFRTGTSQARTQSTNQSCCLFCFSSTNQSLFLCLTVRVLENTVAIQCQQHRFPDGGAEPPTKNSFGFYHNSTALFIIWCLATRPNNWIVCCKRSNESFGKKGAH